MNVSQELAKTATCHSGKDALRFENKTLTYSDLFRKISQTAALLTALGIHKGDRVAIQLPKSLDLLFFHLANLSIGAITLPLNTAYRHEEIDYFLKDSSSTLFVTNEENYRDKKDVLRKISQIECYRVDTDDKGTAETNRSFEPAYPTAADDIALICYTSGTTGKPKGAMITHKNLIENTRAIIAAWQWTPDDVLLHVLPLFHVHGLNVALLGSLLTGSTMIMTVGFDPLDVWNRIGQGEITMLMGVPTMYHRLLNQWQDLTEKPDLGAMRLFVSGSAPLSENLFNRFETLTGHRILERYGMTEAGMIATNPYPKTERKAGSVGYPFPGVDIRIAGENGVDIPSGDVGQIYVRGENVFKGYWQNPQKTEEAFDRSWLKSGDLGYQDPADEGRLFIVGRAKELIITGGYNVYPKEIESVIERHENVEESAVFGLPDEDFGEKVSAAVVLKKTKPRIDEERLIELCKNALAGYKCPKAIFFRDKLPRNAMGKIQKQVLQAEYSKA